MQRTAWERLARGSAKSTSGPLSPATASFRVAGFSTKRGGGTTVGRPTQRPVNLRRRNAHRRPTPNSLHTGTVGDATTLGPYGLKRIDYSVPPRKWPLPPHPPPRQNPIKRYFPLFTGAVGLAVLVFIIINRDDEVYEYWKQVETGVVPMDNDDDDDYDDDDDDLEDDIDEWKDKNK